MGALGFIAATSWPGSAHRRPDGWSVGRGPSRRHHPRRWRDVRSSTAGDARPSRPTYGRATAEEAVMVQQGSSPTSATGTGGAPRAARLSGGVIATIAGGGLLAVFMVQNRDDVTLQFLFWSFTWPLWFFTLITAVLGSLLWIGFGVLRRHRRRVARRDARGD